MKEYKIIYRWKGSEVYQILDKIYSEDTAYMILVFLEKAGCSDARIEFTEPNGIQERCKLIDTQLEKGTEFDKRFILWLLLREYQAKIDIPEYTDTLEEYRKFVFNQNLSVSCGEIIEMLSYELWN